MATVRARVWTRAINSKLSAHEAQLINPRLIDFCAHFSETAPQPCSPPQCSTTSATPHGWPTGASPSPRCSSASESLFPPCARLVLRAALAAPGSLSLFAPRSAGSRGRGFSSSAENGGDAEMPVVYQGPFAAPLRSVKLLSVSTCAVSVALGPVVTFFTMPGVDVLAKGAVASLFVLASASTTGALHWLAAPYIHRIRWRKGSPFMDVEMLTWLATHKTERLRLADVRFPYTNRPLATFSVNGRFYYLETSLLEDEDLLSRLQP